MPIKFNSTIRRYIDASGRAIPRPRVRDEIRKLQDHVAKESTKLSRLLQKGKISSAEFQSRSAALLKHGHIVAATIGRGGRDRMTQSDWGRVGAKIAWQNKYLAKFVRRIVAGTLSPKQTEYRSSLYASALWTTFNQAEMRTLSGAPPAGLNPERCRLQTNSQEGCEECAADEALGWMSVDDMGEIGTRICGDFCKCDIIFENDELNVEDFEIIMDIELEP